MAKKEKHAFHAGERVCFYMLPKGAKDEAVWHIGKIAALLPKKKPEDEQWVSVNPYEILDAVAGYKPEDWETDAPPYFRVPREIIILDHLSARTLWTPRELPPVVIDARHMCVATHYQFLGVFSSGKGSQEQFPFPWHRDRW